MSRPPFFFLQLSDVGDEVESITELLTKIVDAVEFASRAFRRIRDVRHGDEESESFGLNDVVGDIVAIAAGSYHTLGVRSDGTVVAAGYNAYGQCNVGDWTDIIAVGAGKRHSVGLRSDGTAVAVGHRGANDACDVDKWTDLLEIACGEEATIALRNDGTAVAVGANEDGKCDVRFWEELRLPSKPIT